MSSLFLGEYLSSGNYGLVLGSVNVIGGGGGGATGATGATGAQGLRGATGAPGWGGSGGFVFETSTGESFPALGTDMLFSSPNFYKRVQWTNTFLKVEEKFGGEYIFSEAVNRLESDYLIAPWEVLSRISGTYHLSPDCSSAPVFMASEQGGRTLLDVSDYNQGAIPLTVGTTGKTWGDIKSVSLQKGQSSWWLNGAATQYTCLNTGNFATFASRAFEGQFARPAVTLSLGGIQFVEVTGLIPKS